MINDNRDDFDQDKYHECKHSIHATLNLQIIKIMEIMINMTKIVIWNFLYLFHFSPVLLCKM